LRGIPLRLESPRPDRALQQTAPDSTCREQSALFQRRTILAPIWRMRCISCTLRYHVNQAVPRRTCSHRVTRWPPLTRKSPPLSASLPPPLPLRRSKKMFYDHNVSHSRGEQGLHLLPLLLCRRLLKTQLQMQEKAAEACSMTRIETRIEQPVQADSTVNGL